MLWPRRKKKPRRKAAGSYQARLETLEDRTVPSVFLTDFLPVDGRVPYNRPGSSTSGSVVWVSDGKLPDFEIVSSHSSWDDPGVGPAVAGSDSGAFVVAWAADTRLDDEADPDFDIFAQLYDSAGTRRGPTIQVNSEMQGNQTHPVAAMAADGDFLIAWQSQGEKGNALRAQHFDSSGAPVSGDLLIDSTVSVADFEFAVAMTPLGESTIAWRNILNQYAHAQRYDAAGDTVGAEIVAEVTGVTALTLDAASTLVVVDDGCFQPFGPDGQPIAQPVDVSNLGEPVTAALGPDGILLVAGTSEAQRFTLDGLPQGETIEIAGDPKLRALDAASNGNFIVAWTSDDGKSVEAQRYSDADHSLDEPILVYTETEDDALQTCADVAVTLDGSFVVSWTQQTWERLRHLDSEDSHLGPEVLRTAVWIRRFDAAGVPLGPPLLVNEPPQGQDREVSVLEDAGPFSIDLYEIFEDPNDPVESLRFAHTFQTTDVWRGPLFESLTLDSPNGKLSLTPTPDANGKATILVHAADPAGLIGEATIELTVTPVNDAPTLVTTHRHELLSNHRDSLGIPVAIVAEDIEDPDQDPLYGIAITDYDASQGMLEYSLDGGLSWSEAGVLSPEQALLLPADSETCVRTQPGDLPAEVSAWITYRAWDQTSGTAGGRADVTVNGGTSGFSTNSASWTVTLRPSVGNEFRINPNTGNQQLEPSVAMGREGTSVVVWSTHPTCRVEACLVDAGGNAASVNVPRESGRRDRAPSVAMSDGGEFVIAWTSFGGDEDQWGILAQRFSADGAPLGEEFRVNTTTLGAQIDPSVAMDAQGNFLVVWMSGDGLGQDWDILGQRYGTDGTTLGDEFVVSTTTAGWQVLPRAAMNSDGECVVTWSAEEPASGTWKVYARRFHASGQPEAEELLVTESTDTQFLSAVDVNSTGEFVVAWAGQADGDNDLYARRFDGSGTPIGDAVRVSSASSGSQTTAAVALANSGRALVSWSSQDQDGDGWGIYGRVLDVDGTPTGDEFRINTTTDNDQAWACVATDGRDDFLAVWVGQGPGDGVGVFGQRFELPTTQDRSPHEIVGRVAETGDWWVALPNGSTFDNVLRSHWSTAVSWVDVMSGDFNGDGVDDVVGRVAQTGDWWLMVSVGDHFETQWWGRWTTTVTWVDMMVGDFNGDGRDDIVGRWLEGGEWWVAFSEGECFTNHRVATWTTAVTWVDAMVADVDADGRDDVVARWQEGGEWWVARAQEHAFANLRWGAWSTQVTWVDVLAGDFNDDGATDLAGRVAETGEWWVAIADRDHFQTQRWGSWSSAVTWVDVMVGDFDGDGRADLAGRWLEGGQWWVSCSDDSRFDNRLAGNWSTEVTWIDALVGDFDNDGRDDILARWLEGGQWWGTLSHGHGFETHYLGAWSTDVTWLDVGAPTHSRGH